MVKPEQALEPRHEMQPRTAWPPTKPAKGRLARRHILTYANFRGQSSGARRLGQSLALSRQSAGGLNSLECVTKDFDPVTNLQSFIDQFRPPLHGGVVKIEP